MAGQLWGTNTLGGYMYSDELSDTLRTALQPMERFRQHCDADDATEKGLNSGEQYHWNVYGDVDDDGGTAELDEKTAMPEGNFDISQGSLTITEHGKSIPFSGKLDNLSKHPVSEIIRKSLKNHAARSLDRGAHAQFDATPLTVAPTSGTSTTAVTLETTGTCTVTNNVAMGADHVKAIVDVMKERNIPMFDGDSYFCLAWPTTLRTFKNDLESVKQYTDEGFRQVMNGECGRYEGTRFIEQTNVVKEGWSNGKSDWAYFFGEDTVMEGIAVPEEIRGKIPTDYGRSKGVAWYYLGGFGLVHSDAAQARIVKWDSAA